ncbi:MAG: DNA-directed RNA polymerase subunit alpha [Parcubacteria group bacterium]|nr:DNA-directed RNA polymerase subunit alpha [Parcubacteria group bacterium]
MNIPLPQEPIFEDQKNNVGIFKIEGLYSGYGITLGNALRRVLLSSLEGAAVTSFKIEGVDHEFTTIPGVLEDVIQIMLNLKKLRVKILSDGPETLFIRVKGEKKITGRDIEKNANVEIINKDLVLMTVTDKKASLVMEITVAHGLGYQTSDKIQTEKLSIGTIAVDAIFTPVRSVQDSVEKMRVGERTDYDRLVLKVETDGSISPQDAFSEAVTILINQFKALNVGTSENEKETEDVTEEESEEKPKKAKKAKK